MKSTFNLKLKILAKEFLTVYRKNLDLNNKIKKIKLSPNIKDLIYLLPST